MKPLAFLLIPALLAACKGTEFIHKSQENGLEVAYRWNHPQGKPSELLRRLKNTAESDRSVALTIDLYYQGRTVESLEADTCVKAGQTLNGKLNGIFFIPERLTTEQIKSGDAQVEVTRLSVQPTDCP
ncbi:MAG: hypothetical protein JNM31_09200 [Flavobacteriales bacterium]|nr:hypothetical protein [Flavobacteriales bacterium]